MKFGMYIDGDEWSNDGMPYDPIQGQGQGHGASEIRTIARFEVYLIRHLQTELANEPVLELKHNI